MRGFVFLTILGFGAFWAVDEYMYDGRNTQAAWQQARDLGQSFSSEVQRAIDRAMSGH
jgi:hypothetical protein